MNFTRPSMAGLSRQQSGLAQTQDELDDQIRAELSAPDAPPIPNQMRPAAGGDGLLEQFRKTIRENPNAAAGNDSEFNLRLGGYIAGRRANWAHDYEWRTPGATIHPHNLKEQYDAWWAQGGGKTSDPGDIFYPLVAKEALAKMQGMKFKVDFAGEGPGTGTGFGSWKTQDVGTGKTYDVDRGETAPGFRPAPRSGGGGGVTDPNNLDAMAPGHYAAPGFRQAGIGTGGRGWYTPGEYDQISNSGPAMSALNRAVGRPSVLGPRR